jgi:hypothetical protein
VTSLHRELKGGTDRSCEIRFCYYTQSLVPDLKRGPTTYVAASLRWSSLSIRTYSAQNGKKVNLFMCTP